MVYGWLPQRQPPPACFVRGEGAYLWDVNHKRYFDACAGQINVNVGYGHPDIIAAMRRQMGELTYVAPYFETTAKSGFAAKIATRTPAGLNYVFFTNSGSEAIETAIKVARAVTGRAKIYSTWRSYHGMSLGAASISGDPRRLFAEPGLVGSTRFHGSTCDSCAFGHASPPDCTFACLHHLRETILLDGPETIAAIVLEPITGTSGVHAAQPEFIRGVRRLCDEYGILLVFDETITGWGRTGKWFACEHYGVVPDLLTTAKGITSAYVPLGAVVMTSRIRDFFLDRPFVGGLTNEGHALACAAGLANMAVLEKESLVERSRALGERLMRGLSELKSRHLSVMKVRGQGLLACVELTSDPDSGAPLAGYRDYLGNVSKEITDRMFRCGTLVIAKWDFIFVAPPLVVEEQQLDEMLNALDEALSYTDGLMSRRNGQEAIGL